MKKLIGLLAIVMASSTALLGCGSTEEAAPQAQDQEEYTERDMRDDERTQRQQQQYR